VGAYSSIFLAAPWVVDMAERGAVIRRHNQKVASKRAGTEDEKPARKAAKASDEDDDRLVLAKSEDIPLELLEEPEKAASGSGGSNRSAGSGKKRKRR
jgi:preprotein translocase subunit SecF